MVTDEEKIQALEDRVFRLVSQIEPKDIEIISLQCRIRVKDKTIKALTNKIRLYEKAEEEEEMLLDKLRNLLERL